MTTHLTPTAEMAPTTPFAGSTPGHTIGPFFHDAFAWANADGAGSAAAGTGHLWIEGSVEDGTGKAIPAWLIEAWVPQAVEAERAAGLAAPGFRRVPNGPGGRFGFHVPPPAPGQPAAFVTLFGLGLTRHFCTAVFAGEPPPGSESELLRQLPPERRATLVATALGDGRFDWTVHTQGDRETVFLDYR